MEAHRDHGSSSGWSQESRKLFRLESLDRFQKVDPLTEREGDEYSAIFNATEGYIAVLKLKYSVDTQYDCDSKSDSEWENGDEIDFERNAFDAFGDELDL